MVRHSRTAPKGRTRPLDDGLAPLLGRPVLPRIIEGQVHLEAAAGNHAAAADVHQPVVLAQRLPGLAGTALQRGGGILDLVQNGRQRIHGHVRIIPERHQRLPLAFQFVQQVRAYLGTRRQLHDLEQRAQRRMVRQRIVARHQPLEAAIQLVESQHGADPFVEGVQVDDHGLTG